MDYIPAVVQEQLLVSRRREPSRGAGRGGPSAGAAGLAITDRDGVYGIVARIVKAHETRQCQLDRRRRGHGRTTARRSCCSPNRRATRTSAGSHGAAGCAAPKGESRVDVGRSLRACRGLDRAVGRRAQPPRREARARCDRRRRPAGAFGDRLYAMVARHRRDEESRQEARLRSARRASACPSSRAVEVLYHTPSRRRAAGRDHLHPPRRHHSPRPGGCLKPNAEHALKSPARASRALFADDPAAVARARTSRRALHLLARPASLPLSRRSGCPTARRLRRGCAQLTSAGARERYGGRGPAQPWPSRLDKELALIDELDYGGYFLTMWEIVRVLPRAGHPLPGPRLGGELGGLLLPRHHGRRPGAHGPAVRALPLQRARRAPRHRSRHRCTSGAKR